MAGKRAAQSRQTDLYNLQSARSLFSLMYLSSQGAIIVVAVSRRLASGDVGNPGWVHICFHFEALSLVVTIFESD